MAYKTDYASIKRTTSFQSVIQWLGLTRRSETRFDCPISAEGKRAIAINPDWKNKDGTFGRFTCFACEVHGDMIALSAHILKTTDKKAAQEIEKQLIGYEPAKRGLPDDGLDLTYEHARVQALGLSPERAKELGVGYRNRGVTKNAVLIPIRDNKGKLLGYAMYYDPPGLSFYKGVL